MVWLCLPKIHKIILILYLSHVVEPNTATNTLISIAKSVNNGQMSPLQIRPNMAQIQMPKQTPNTPNNLFPILIPPNKPPYAQHTPF